MGPLKVDSQGFWYLFTIRDHALTFRIVYPLKSKSDAPNAIMVRIAHLLVQLGAMPRELRTDNAWEFVLANFTTTLEKMGIGFYPSLPYSPQENGEAKRLNHTYRPPSVASLYPFGTKAIVHVLAIHQKHKLAMQGIEWRLLKPLLASGGWLLWNRVDYRMIHSESVIFPRFQTANTTNAPPSKGSLPHVLNAMRLRDVPTEIIFRGEKEAIDSLILAKDISTPEHLGQSMSGLHRQQWEQACFDELEQMQKREVWHVVDKEPGMKTIGHWLVFDTKLDKDGNVRKLKACLVTCGDRQRPGVDCTEMYAHTASLMSLRLLLATACLWQWKVSSFNVSGAYLYSLVEETVFMEPPTHFIPSTKGKVLRLRKALYGMRQAGHCWWQHLLGVLENLGFTSCKVDQLLYIFRKCGTIVAIWIHIDSGMVTSNFPAAIVEFQKVLCNNFEIKWPNTVRSIVGLECTFGEGEVTIVQSRLTEDILRAYPRVVVHHDCPLSPLPDTTVTDKGVVMDATPFSSVVGSLAYLVSRCCPDLAFAVNYLARHSMAPTVAHWEMLDCVVGYLLKTQKSGIVLRLGILLLNMWDDELEQSQSGLMLKLGDAPIMWESKWQSMVALSTCAAEYITLSDSAQHLVWAISQLTQLVGNFKKTIFCNNQAALQVLIDNLSWKRMRYLDRAFFVVNDMICKHGIMVKWVKTQEMQADALTKRLLGPSLFQAVSFLRIMGNR
ncbi:hypothetical protein O181_085278 [Austropuccinia psidii MF-1]|uniref:Integrase catalytic domain-containing protein n=1 Tax=Austropuccinia psidii MF-1 TaxID=1389203 RepID=A0A9Q3FX72_9BASI|nr:hypothetical protein [Austropuccinia psidii MF-1]